MPVAPAALPFLVHMYHLQRSKRIVAIAEPAFFAALDGRPPLIQRINLGNSLFGGYGIKLSSLINTRDIAGFNFCRRQAKGEILLNNLLYRKLQLSAERLKEQLLERHCATKPVGMLAGGRALYSKTSMAGSVLATSGHMQTCLPPRFKDFWYCIYVCTRSMKVTRILKLNGLLRAGCSGRCHPWTGSKMAA